MPTTTNYGWTTPADTDLVKDGAAAIRTLGSGVDTTVKNLNPETTLGDISYRSSTSNTNTRLALGTAGQVLTVNSGATAPEWQTISAGGMTTLTTMTLSGSSVTSSTFSSTGYKQLMIYLKGVYGSTADDLMMRINGDTGSNYCFHGFRGAGGGTQYGRNTNTTALNVGLVSASTSTTKQKASGLIYITNPADTDVVNINHQISAFDDTNMYATAGSGCYDSSAAITSITLYPASGTFSGGTAEIIGLK